MTKGEDLNVLCKYRGTEMNGTREMDLIDKNKKGSETNRNFRVEIYVSKDTLIVLVKRHDVR